MKITTNSSIFRIKDPPIPGRKKPHPSKIDFLLTRIQSDLITPGIVLEAFLEQFLSLGLKIHQKRFLKQRLTPRILANVDFIESIIKLAEEKVEERRSRDADRS